VFALALLGTQLPRWKGGDGVQIQMLALEENKNNWGKPKESYSKMQYLIFG